ncbi:hypothetical protein Ndes2437B_g00681 [Nannochloris sp. 'desiccata']
METSGAYLAFDILESLKHARDTMTCLEGLNKLRTALKSQDGVHVLGQLAEATPNFEELIIIWDSQIKAQEHHVAITLMLTSTAIFTALSTKSKPPPSAAAVNAANALATALLSRRLRSFYSHLASQQRTRATAALLLLAAIASFSPWTARELVRVFDFGLSALPQLARSIRPRKGETTEQAGVRQLQEWANSDPLKRPTRAAFTTLCQTLLLSADAQLLPEVIRLRSLLGGVLHHMSNDPPVVQLEMLKIMQKRVVASKVPLGPATRAELFSDATLGQLAAICAAGEDDDGIAADEEESIGKIRRQASDLSFSILHSVCTDPGNGLCSGKEACFEFRTLQSSAISALNPGQRRLLRWLQRLKPAESSRQGELLRATVAHDPALAAAMLLSLPYSLEPTANGKWLVHASIVGSLMQSVASAQVGLLELAERGLAPPELSSRSMQAVLRCAFPLTLQRSALSRGVQHSNALVRHAVLCLLSNMLSVLQSILEEVQKAAAALPLSSVLVQQEWNSLVSAIQQTARACLPDLQPILAQLSAAVNPSQKNNTGVTFISDTNTDKKKGRVSAMEIELDTINIVLPESDDDSGEEEALQVAGAAEIGEGSGKKASLNTALFSATMHVLQRWRRSIPISFAESNVDAEKLVPEELSALPPLHQLQMVALLQTDSGSSARKKEEEGGASFVKTSSTGPALLPVLKLLASCDENEQPEVKIAASRWAVQRLTSTGLFEANPAEAFLWIDLIPVSASGVESGFLYDAIGLVLRKPGEFYSFVEAEGISGASRGMISSRPAVEMSLLVLCVLRQALRVLNSDKKSIEEKTAIATYTARVAALAVMQQREQSSSAAASAALLSVLLSEAPRETGAADAGDNNATITTSVHKRKACRMSSIAAVHAMLGGLGPSAEPLAALATWLEAVASSPSLVAGNVSNDALEEIDGKKKAKKEGSQDGGGVAVANGEITSNSASLSLAVVHFGRRDSLTWSIESIVEYVSTLLESDAASQSAPLVIRQALHFICATFSPIWKSQPHAASMLCAVLRGAIATTLKHPSSFKQAESCISLVCSSESLLNAIESSETVGVELWQWLLKKVTASATKGTSSTPSLFFSLRVVVSRVINKASVAISKIRNFQHAPPPAVSKLLPLAVAAAHGPSEVEAAKNVLCSLLESISNNIKTVDVRWITTTGKAVTSLLVSASDEDVELVLDAGCRVVADLLVAQRSREACVLLEQLLQPHHHHHTTFTKVLQLLDNDVISAALTACVTAPTLQKSSLACVLLKNSAVARAAFQDALEQGTLVGESSSLIALLPALTTFFESLKKENRDASAAGDDVKGLKGAASAILKQLLAWITKEEKEELGEELLEVLHAWGLRYLTLALPIAKPPENFILEALHSLLPADSTQWSLTSLGLEKAAAVDALLHYLLSISSAKAVAAAQLAPLARTFFFTVSAAFKTKFSSKSSAQNKIEQRLLQLLDASLSDAVAALPDSERTTSAFAKIAADACNVLGTAVLRKRAEDPVAMRVLRRFAAALLPSNDGGDENENEDSDEDIVEELSNSKVAVAAAELFQKVVSHSHFLSTMKNAPASPPALPAAAAVVPLPLESVLPFAEAPPGSDPSKEQGEEEETLLQREPLAKVKRELCILLETLLDIEDTFQSFKRSSGAELLAVETALLPVVMAAYGGSCSAADRAAWDLAKSINLRAWKRKKSQQQKNGLKKMEVDDRSSSDSDNSDEEGEHEVVRDELCALLEGPLAKTCFAWGPGAVAAAASLPNAAANGEFSSRLRALQSKLPIDPVRCALTVTHFPEKCLLFGGGGDGSGHSSGEDAVKPAAGSDGTSNTEAVADHISSLPEGLARLLPTSPAAYDPSFLIPFCVAALRVGLLPPRLFAQAGLASVCLRATAAEDPGLRGMAYEALGLLTQELQSGARQQKIPFEAEEHKLAAPGGAEHTASFEQPKGDFKERAQLLSLLEWVRDALETPFTRLPAVHAVFLAEAALLVSHPSHPMFGPVSKARLKTATLDVSLVPLFRQTILSGSQEARVERSWLLRLLRAGLRSSADARVYLRQYIFELVMSLYDAVSVDSGTSSLALGVILAACSVPRAARELVERGGLVGWLSSRAASSTSGAIASTNQKTGLNKFKDAVSIVNALHTLTTLRAVVGGGKGSARAAEDYAQACRCLLSMLCSLSASESALTPSQVSGLAKVWAATLPVVSWTEEAAAGAGVAFLGAGEIQVVEGTAQRIDILSKKTL